MVKEEIPAQDSYEPWLEVPVDVKDITREFLLQWWFLRMTRNMDSSYSRLQFSSFLWGLSSHFATVATTSKAFSRLSLTSPIWRVVWSQNLSYIIRTSSFTQKHDVWLLQNGCVKMRPRHICMLLALWVLAIDSALDPWTRTISPFAIAKPKIQTGSTEVFWRSCLRGERKAARLRGFYRLKPCLLTKGYQQIWRNVCLYIQATYHLS